MNLHVFETVAALNEKLIAHVLEVANNAIATNGRFNFVLTGGNSPKALYTELATTHKHKVDWDKVYFFFGDERYVLPDHKDYNGLMAKNHLFDDLGIAQDHIFYIDTTLPANDAANSYANAINAHFNGAPPIFDLILLGMGDDAHTASIFPNTELVKYTEATVAAVFVEKLDTYRISLTAPLINMAKNIAFITFGDSKANALKHVIGDHEKDYFIYPAQLIKPINGNLDWFVDEKAAALLAK